MEREKWLDQAWVSWKFQPNILYLSSILEALGSIPSISRCWRPALTKIPLNREGAWGLEVLVKGTKTRVKIIKQNIV